MPGEDPLLAVGKPSIEHGAVKFDLWIG